MKIYVLVYEYKDGTISVNDDPICIIKIIVSKLGYMPRTNLGTQIKARRIKLKLSQDKLARKADIPFSTLVKVEAGYTPNPSIETMMKIADALGVGLDELVGRSKRLR